MKKLIAVLLICATLFLTVSCKETSPAVSSDSGAAGSEIASSSSGADEASESAGASSEQAEPLPAYSTLRGTVHLPPIGNQGGIGSCTSFGVTYMQFNIAVSQYLHSIQPNTKWDPSSGNERNIFSPKFSYVLAGASTSSCYNVLMDHGCLTKKATFFSNPRSPQIYSGNKFAAQTTRWDVKEGQLQSALKYRITNYEEIENTSMQLTSNKTLMNKVKSAIAAGNGVAICGWSGYWQYKKIDDKGLGNLGEKGDMVIYAAKDTNKLYGGNGDTSGNHCVCLVGYDDDITCTVGGVTLKGAFLMANSWGDGWMNDGFVWMMYDSFNTQSEYPALNYDELYTGASDLCVGAKDARFFIGLDCADSPRLKITATGEKTTVEGKEYPLYTIASEDGENYLGYQLKNGKLKPKVGKDASESRFALIPYTDAVAWNSFDTHKMKDNYKESYLIYAADAGLGTGDAVFLSGGSYNQSGRSASFDALSDGSGQDALCMTVKSIPNEGSNYSFVVQTSTFNGKTAPRTAVNYRFSFLYWDKDITVGLPGAMLELEVENYKREGIKIVLSRTDAAGNTVSKIPAVFGENAANINDLFSDKSMTFGGQIADSTSTYEKAYLTVGYNEFADLMEGYSPENFLWSFTYKSLGTRLLSVSLKDKDGNVLQKVVPTEKDRTLEKGEEVSFLFDLGGTLKEYSASPDGDRRIVNAADGSYLTFNKMLLNPGKTADENTSFTLTKNAETGGVQIFRKGENYLFDIAGKEIKNGVTVKMNAPSGKRNTQDWGITDLKNGYFRIYLASDPGYVLCNDPTNGICLTNVDTDSKNCQWSFEAVGTGIAMTVKAVAENGKLSVTGIAPEKEGGKLSVRLLDGESGETVQEKSITSKDGSFGTTLDQPKPGTYLLCAMRNGIAYGTQYIFTVR